MPNRSKKSHHCHIILLSSLLFSVSVLPFVFIKNYRSFIYPIPHTEQQSPKKFVEEKTKVLPPEIIKPEVIEHGSRNKHQVALTFDADMTWGMDTLLKRGLVKSWYDPEIKKTLYRENVKATFFLTGLWVRDYPGVAKELAQNPLFEIGNHSLSHPAFTKNCFRLPFIGNSQDKDEIVSAQEIIRSTTGVTPKYFRFPGGCYDNVDLENVAKLGLKIVHWDVVSGDAYFKTTEQIVANVLPKVRNGSIIVFHIHDNSFAPKTNEALKQIIPTLKKQGYQFVTISELLAK